MGSLTQASASTSFLALAHPHHPLPLSSPFFLFFSPLLFFSSPCLSTPNADLTPRLVIPIQAHTQRSQGPCQKTVQILPSRPSPSDAICAGNPLPGEFLMRIANIWGIVGRAEDLNRRRARLGLVKGLLPVFCGDGYAMAFHRTLPPWVGKGGGGGILSRWWLVPFGGGEVLGCGLSSGGGTWSFEGVVGGKLVVVKGGGNFGHECQILSFLLSVSFPPLFPLLRSFPAVIL